MFFCLYNLAGFNIKYIHCDNEYQSLINELQEAYNVKMIYGNTQEHFPEIERSIRVIKERFRATFHHLPFLKLPADSCNGEDKEMKFLSSYKWNVTLLQPSYDYSPRKLGLCQTLCYTLWNLCSGSY
jgi:hypothetical protein